MQQTATIPLAAKAAARPLAAEAAARPLAKAAARSLAAAAHAAAASVHRRPLLLRPLRGERTVAREDNVPGAEPRWQCGTSATVAGDQLKPTRTPRC